jgi:uncharacterized protein YjeT (DUF2065 family)
MTLKRFSLYYLISYLGLGGIGFLAAPTIALQMLQSNGSYSEIMVRTVGAFMIALATLLLQTLRHQLDVIVRTTVFVRIFFITCFVGFFVATHDPLFLTITAIVSVGLGLTVASYLRAGENPFSVAKL